MEKSKSRKIATYKDFYFTTIEYEYRGHRYDVTYSNSWTACTTPARIQHQDAQERIDKMIERKENANTTEPIDWDDIFRLIQGE